uniref:Uncharacterized protein n=1 Tax=Arundo donax TaxID=35708 RepID=A0A0A9B4E0_ARUDO
MLFCYYNIFYYIQDVPCLTARAEPGFRQGSGWGTGACITSSLYVANCI